MSELVSINHTKENTLEFDASVEGVDSKDISAKFVIKAKDMELAFDAKAEKGGKWSVKIPPLPMLERTAYKCFIAVVADGYYFEPLKGTINVVGSAQPYASAPKNKTLAAEDKKEEKKEEKAETKKKANESWKSREKSIEQIANELMQKQQERQQPAAVVMESTTQPEATVSNKDDKVHAILEEFGIKPKGNEKKPRVSFFKKD